MSFKDPEGVPWQPAPGYGAWGRQRILLEDKERGVVIRVLECLPGFAGTETLQHDDDEEFAWVLEGNAVSKEGSHYGPGMYCIVPGGAPHGPFSTGNGITLLEVRYATNHPAREA